MEVTLSNEQLESLADLIVAKSAGKQRRTPYNVAEAAAALGCCAATIRRNVAAGITPRLAGMGKILIPASHIESMQKGQTI